MNKNNNNIVITYLKKLINKENYDYNINSIYIDA